MLGNLHDWHGEYRAAIPFYERIIREYAKVDLEYIVCKDNRYAVLNSIANCYAALGERSRATKSFLQAVPLAETEGYREWAIHRALEYEPRLMSERFALPEGVREMLLEIADRSAFWVTLNAGSGSKPDGHPIEVSYHLRGRADCRIDWYRMVYRVWQLPADDRVSENAEPAPLAPTEIARPTIAWSTEKTLDVWEGHRNHGIRAWVASPPNYHRTLWDLPFQTNRWPPDAEAESGLGLMPEKGVLTEEPVNRDTPLDGAALQREGTIILRGLPPGRYLVSVVAVELERSRQPFSATPSFRRVTAFAWNHPTVIEVSGSTVRRAASRRLPGRASPDAGFW